MVEPIQRKPVFKKEDSIQANLVTLTESQMEPIGGLQAVRGTMSEQVIAPGEERFDSMVEPIRGNQALFERQSSVQQQPKTKIESQLEQRPQNTPMFKEVSKQAISDKSSQQALMQVDPVFEKVGSRKNTVHDTQMHQTEAQPHDTEEIEAGEHVLSIDEVQQQPLAKKIKRILYSDKSESSIDENMEDTPSNYNIPNGRLDGRSLGLKANLYPDRKRNREAKRKISGTTTGTSNAALIDALQKTLQPVPSDTIGNMVPEANMTITQNHYFSPPRGSTQPPMNKLF